MRNERIRVVDFEEKGHSDAFAQRLRGSCRPIFKPFGSFQAHASQDSRLMRIPPATQATHAHQVIGGKAQQRLARELGLTNKLGFGHTTHCLTFSSKTPFPSIKVRTAYA